MIMVCLTILFIFTMDRIFVSPWPWHPLLTPKLNIEFQPLSDVIKWESLWEKGMSCDWGIGKWNYCPFSGTLESSHCFLQHVNAKWQVSNVQLRREPPPEPNHDGKWSSDVFPPDQREIHTCCLWPTQPVAVYCSNING